MRGGSRLPPPLAGALGGCATWTEAGRCGVPPFLKSPFATHLTRPFRITRTASIHPTFATCSKTERLVVTSLTKECESAVNALRRRQEDRFFDRERPELYSLCGLKDLAGVRVAAFPRNRLAEADGELRKRLPSWAPDPIPGYANSEEPMALRYHGYCKARSKIRGEFQIVPILTALFREAEHSAIYKPSPRLHPVAQPDPCPESSR